MLGTFPFFVQFNFFPFTLAAGRLLVKLKYLNNYWLDCHEVLFDCNHRCQHVNISVSFQIFGLSTCNVIYERLGLCLTKI